MKSTTHPGLPCEPGPLACACALLALAALAWLAVSPAPLPAPLPANAPAGQFSAQRAFRHVQALAQAPRPIATQANRQARQYLVDQLRAIGLDAQVQTATVQKNNVKPFAIVHVTLAVVHNVVVRVPGAAPDHASRPALLLATHYDSADATYGAADGAASAAALLETARALRAGPPLPYDVVLLFADGEKKGSLGMQAFAEQHPLAARAGTTLQFENRGNQGPLVLYDASHAGREAIAGWARGAPQPHGSSLMQLVYKLMPGAPAPSPLAQLDAPLLRFSTVQGALGIFDTPARLDQRSLQHEGESMLGMARQFAHQPLVRVPPAEQVVFALPPLGVIHYSVDAAWTFTRLACLLLVGVCCLAAQRQQVKAVETVKGAFNAAFFGWVLIVAADLLWTHVPALHRAFEPAAGEYGQRYLLGVSLLAIALYIWMLRRLQESVHPAEAALGGLVWIGCLLVVVNWVIPGASYVLVWPLLAASAAFAILHTSAAHSSRLVILVAGLAPAVALVAPALKDSFIVLTPREMEVPLVLLAAILALAITLLTAVARRFVVRPLALAGLACLLLSGAASPQRPTPLQANPLVYYNDMPTWRAWWLAYSPKPDQWTRQFFPNLERPRRLWEVFGWDSDDLWYAVAERSQVAFPHAVLLKNEREPKRHAEFVLTSKNRAPRIELKLFGSEPLRTEVNSRALTETKSRVWSMSLYGMDDTPLHFSMDMVADDIFWIRVEERMPGVPAQALPRPLPAASYIPATGTTIAADTLIFY